MGQDERLTSHRFDDFARALASPVSRRRAAMTAEALAHSSRNCQGALVRVCPVCGLTVTSTVSAPKGFRFRSITLQRSVVLVLTLHDALGVKPSIVEWPCEASTFFRVPTSCCSTFTLSPSAV